MKISSIPKSGRKGSVVYVNSRHGKVARQCVRRRKAPPRSGLASAVSSTSPFWGCCRRQPTAGATSPSFPLPAMACRKPVRPSGFAPPSTLTAGPMSQKWSAPASPPQPHSEARRRLPVAANRILAYRPGVPIVSPQSGRTLAVIPSIRIEGTTARLRGHSGGTTEESARGRKGRAKAALAPWLSQFDTATRQRTTQSNIESDRPPACVRGGRVCKMHGAKALVVQVAMILHLSAFTKGDAKTL